MRHMLYIYLDHAYTSWKMNHKVKAFGKFRIRLKTWEKAFNLFIYWGELDSKTAYISLKQLNSSSCKHLGSSILWASGRTSVLVFAPTLSTMETRVSTSDYVSAVSTFMGREGILSDSEILATIEANLNVNFELPPNDRVRVDAAKVQLARDPAMQRRVYPVFQAAMTAASKGLGKGKSYATPEDLNRQSDVQQMQAQQQAIALQQAAALQQAQAMQTQIAMEAMRAQEAMAASRVEPDAVTVTSDAGSVPKAETLRLQLSRPLAQVGTLHLQEWVQQRDVKKRGGLQRNKEPGTLRLRRRHLRKI